MRKRSHRRFRSLGDLAKFAAYGSGPLGVPWLVLGLGGYLAYRHFQNQPAPGGQAVVQSTGVTVATDASGNISAKSLVAAVGPGSAVANSVQDLAISLLPKADQLSGVPSSTFSGYGRAWWE